MYRSTIIYYPLKEMGGQIRGYSPPPSCPDENEKAVRLLLVDDSYATCEERVQQFMDDVFQNEDVKLRHQRNKQQSRIDLFYTASHKLAEALLKDSSSYEFDGVMIDLYEGDQERSNALFVAERHLKAIRSSGIALKTGVLAVSDHPLDSETRESVKTGLPYRFIYLRGSEQDSHNNIRELQEFFEYIHARHYLRTRPWAKEFDKLVGVNTLLDVVTFLTLLEGDSEGDRMPVVILGGSGTGKESIARLIHAQDRLQGNYQYTNLRQERFQPVLIAGIGEGVLEAELFGITKLQNAEPHDGYIKRAERGTLFVDEVGDVPFKIQGKLLRFLQEQEIHPIGGEWDRIEDVRTIFATHADLIDQATNGKFREDFLHRIDGLTLRLPNLQMRTDEHLMLIEHFLVKNGVEKKSDRDLGSALHTEVKDRLMQDCKEGRFTGNIRQLERVIKRLVRVNVQDTPITMEDYQRAMELSLIPLK